MLDLVKMIRERWADKWPPPGAGVVVAVSGGADSIGLLHVLARLAPELDLQLFVAHANHLLRGPESDSDESFVSSLAESLELRFTSARLKVREEQGRTADSMEMTARRLRHRFLAETALQQKCRFIAFAHHADDQAELILIRLFRGGGSDGLGGMSALSPSPEDSRIALFRPFLGLRRTEIRVWLDQEGLKFREDASNTDLSIIRNRIRAGLIPQLETEYSPGLTKTLCRTAEILNADGDFIRQESLRWLGAADRPDFATLHIALQRAVLREQLWRLGHNPDFDLIERLRTNASMLQSAGGENLFARDLAGTVTPSRRPPIRRSSSSNGKAAEEKPGQVDFSIHAARGSVQLDGTTIHWSRRMRPLPFGKPGVEQFDLELLGAELRLRHWRPGDRYRPLGFPRDAKLQDIFVSRKIPRDARSKLVFLEQRPEGEIAWVQGLPPAETVKVTPTTSSLLVLRWNPD